MVPVHLLPLEVGYPAEWCSNLVEDHHFYTLMDLPCHLLQMCGGSADTDLGGHLSCDWDEHSHLSYHQPAYTSSWQESEEESLDQETYLGQERMSQ